MSIIAMPASVGIRRVTWTLDRPAQVNRSGYSGKRTVVAIPWHGRWSAKVELAPIVGEANVRAWRAFLAKLKGQIHSFLLPATEGPQHVLGTLYPAITNHANTTVTDQGGNVTRITKTGGVNGTGDAGAVSAVGFSGDFSLKCTFSAGANDAAAGVNTDPLTNDNSGTLDFAWAIFTGGLLAILQSGSQIGGFYSSANPAWIWRTGTTLGMGRGASLAAAQAAPDWTGTNSAPLYFDSALGTIGDYADVIFSGTQTLPTAASGAAQGATSITLSNAPSSLSAGSLATVTLPSGNRQLVMLTADMAASVITFEPPLREAISSGAQVDTSTPCAQVSLADSAFGWSVDPGAVYGLAFDVDEAF